MESSLHGFHIFMDKACRWVVSAAAAVTCLVCTTPDDVTVPLFLIAGVFSAVSGKVLKRILRQRRPDGATQRSHGMPSSHAISLTFLGCAASLGVARTAPAAFSLVAIPVILALMIYWMLLRIKLGHHTIAQVAVGLGWGFLWCALTASANFGFEAPPNGRAAEFSRTVKDVILVVFIVSCCSFAVRYSYKWWNEPDQ